MARVPSKKKWLHQFIISVWGYISHGEGRNKQYIEGMFKFDEDSEFPVQIFNLPFSKFILFHRYVFSIIIEIHCIIHLAARTLCLLLPWCWCTSPGRAPILTPQAWSRPCFWDEFWDDQACIHSCVRLVRGPELLRRPRQRVSGLNG